MRVFERPGPVNTDAVIDIVKKGAYPQKHVVVASVSGGSAVKAAGTLRDKRVICVTCPQGMYWEVEKMNKGPFADIPELAAMRDEWKRKGSKRVPMDVTEENRAALARLGATVIKGTIPLFGPSFSMRLHLGHITSLDVMAKTLELISTGTLVCLESVLMAVDAGAVPEGEQVICMAGTESGLDTCWIVRGCASANLFHPEKGFRLIELLAKPGISAVPDIGIEYLR